MEHYASPNDNANEMPDPEEVAELGRYYLEMLGMGEVADEPLIGQDGTPMRTPAVEGPLTIKEFLHFCWGPAVGKLDEFDEMDPSHPDYAHTREVLRDTVRRMTGQARPEQA